MPVALLVFALTKALALGQADVPDAHDHPAVKRWPGSVITASDRRAFDAFKFPVKDGETKKVEGKYLLNVYRLPPKVTCAQATRSFGSAFKDRGLTVHSGTAVPADDLDWTNGKWVSGEGNAETGGQLFVLAGCPTDNFEGPELFLWVVDNQKLQPPVMPDAAAMAEAISRAGHLALYGVTFTNGKAELSPDSSKALEQIAAMLKANPDWKLRIDAHSDNAAGARSSLALSKKRAEAVKTWLTSKLEVAADRLTAEGVGDKKPLSPNTSEIGRANNRRIELTKL